MQATLSQGHGYAVSDSSFKDEAGSAAWIIKGLNSEVQLRGQWYTPGHTDNHSSFQSKLAGIVGVLYTLTFWPLWMAMPNFQLACDSLSVITWLQALQPINPIEPHANLLEAARHLIQICGYHIELVFVRGHQNTGQPMVLTHNAWLNVKVDQLAKQKVIIPHTGLLVYKLPGNKWGWYTETKHIVKQVTATLQMFINGWECQEYWAMHKNLSPKQLMEVYWMPLGRAMQSVPLAR